MKLKIEQVTALIEKCTSPAEAAKAISLAEDIVSKLGNLRRHKDALVKDLQAQIKATEAEMITQQLRCNHPSKTYYADPSGGSDSHRECNICGAILP